MKTLLRAWLLGWALAGSTAASAAAQVEVRYIDPQSFVDAGWGSVERERNLDILSRHMQSWATRLPDGTTLTLEVLDLDLAGECWRVLRRPDLRVMDGRLDGPRMTLRWTLVRGDQVLRSGEERLSDMNYLMSSFGPHLNEALGYDKRMLDRWLKSRVLGDDARP